MGDSVHFAVRRTENKQAILFVHGFHGDPQHTFGMLPAFLAGDPRLFNWDIHCYGYPTGLAPDISGVWAADPNLTTLAGHLDTLLALDKFRRYTHLALVAHSMGGLIVQRALLDGGFADRTSHVVLFGTPSNGLRKAGLARWFKRQVAQWKPTDRLYRLTDNGSESFITRSAW